MIDDNNYYEISLLNTNPKPTIKRISSLSNLNFSGPGNYYVKKLSQSQLNLSNDCRQNFNNNKPEEYIKSEENSQINHGINKSFKLKSFSKALEKRRFSDQNSLYSFNSDESSNLSTFEPPAETTVLSLTDESSPRSTIIEKEKPNILSLSTISSNDHLNSIPKLIRTKTKYLSSSETKSRKLLRKQNYDDNDSDDTIYDNDIPLVFNVPVIKDYGALYSRSSDSKILRNDLLTDSKYPKPNPTPRKLSATDDYMYNNLDSGSVNSDVNLNSTPNSNTEPNLVSNSNSNSNHNLYNIAEDAEITRNIQNFYKNRSVSQHKLLKSNRENHVYKLPQYIKSQSSIEDLQFFSPEKLNYLDQSRPINLPPKLATDKSKHTKQFHQTLNQYETNCKLLSDSRSKLSESFASSQQQWYTIYENLFNSENCNTQKQYDKHRMTIRKLSWHSNIPFKIRYLFLSKLLSINNASNIDSINEQFIKANKKFVHLTDTIKSNKDQEFNKIIDFVISRPLFRCILEEAQLDLATLKSNFRFLLYIKSLTESGLQKQDENLLIPLCLILFGESQTLHEIFSIIELINIQIFNREFLNSLNSDFNRWSDSRNLPHSYLKDLSKFNSLQEFENLNSNKFLDVILQLDDKLPLSLSAPSTPISGSMGKFFSPDTSMTNLSQISSLEIQDSDESKEIDSSALHLMIRLLQTMIIYSCSPKTKLKNNLKTIQTFSLTIFQYYHFNWNSCDELVRENKSIKLNYSADKAANLDSFVDKWKQHFK